MTLGFLGLGCGDVWSLGIRSLGFVWGAGSRVIGFGVVFGV